MASSTVFFRCHSISVAFSPVRAASLDRNNTILSLNDPEIPVVKFSSPGATLESSWKDLFFFFFQVDFRMQKEVVVQWPPSTLDSVAPIMTPKSTKNFLIILLIWSMVLLVDESRFLSSNML